MMDPTAPTISIPSSTVSAQIKQDAEIGRLHRAAFPTVSPNRLAMIYGRFGHIPAREKDFEKMGCSIYWKTDRRWVNQGNCFYNQTNDVYYHRSTRRELFPTGEMSPRDVAQLEIGRTTLDPGYTHLTFYVSPPPGDAFKRKIVPCDNHFRESGHRTFLGVEAVTLSTPPQIFEKEKYDLFQFDIRGCSETFLLFRVQFYCWTVCKRIHFSNKKENLIFNAVFSGSNLPNVCLTSTINIQQNPGRGSSSTAMNKSIPNINSTWAANSEQFLQTMRSKAGSEGTITVHNEFDVCNIRIEIPPNFHLIMGATHTTMVMDEIKRDVQFLVEGKLNDAVARKPTSNPELLKRKEELEDENRQLRAMNQQLSITAREACQMNDHILQLQDAGIFGPGVDVVGSSKRKNEAGKKRKVRSDGFGGMKTRKPEEDQQEIIVD